MAVRGPLLTGRRYVSFGRMVRCGMQKRCPLVHEHPIASGRRCVYVYSIVDSGMTVDGTGIEG